MAKKLLRLKHNKPEKQESRRIGESQSLTGRGGVNPSQSSPARAGQIGPGLEAVAKLLLPACKAAPEKMVFGSVDPKKRR